MTATDLIEQTMFDRALELARLGVPVFPLQPRGKAPLLAGGFKSAAAEPSLVEQAWKRWPNANIGIATGGPLRLLVVDVDGPAGQAFLACLEKHHGALPETRASTTGKGRHLLFVVPEGRPLPRCSAGDGLDIRCAGGYIVGPGSIHPNGRQYAWANSAPVAVAPEWLIGFANNRKAVLATLHTDAKVVSIESKRPAPALSGERPAALPGGRNLAAEGANVAAPELWSEQLKARIYSAMPFVKAPGRDGWWECAAALHSTGGGPEAYEAFVVWSRNHAGGNFVEGSHEMTWADLDQRGRGGIAIATFFAKAKEGGWVPRAVIAPTDAAKTLGEVGRDEATLPGTSRYSTARNFLRASGRAFSYDRMGDQLLIEGAPVQPGFEARARDAIIHATGVDPGAAAVADALASLCHANAFDSLKDSLNELVWDGVKRLDKWLTTYVGAEDTLLNQSFARKFLIGLVGRGLCPGLKVDTVLVLEGCQGGEKSSLCEALVGRDGWFLDNDPSHLPLKERGEALRGRWLIELAELSGVRRGDVESVKAFLSQRNDRYRPAYERRVADFPRRCVFIASVNPDGSGYLLDPTGNRRFWPVKVGRIDLTGFKAARDQLLAEAVAAFKGGESVVLPRELWDAAREVQEERRERDPWEDVLADLEGKKAKVRGGDAEFISSADLLGGEKLKIPPERQRGDLGKRARRVMATLGWTYDLLWVEFTGKGATPGLVKMRGYWRPRA